MKSSLEDQIRAFRSLADMLGWNTEINISDEDPIDVTVLGSPSKMYLARARVITVELERDGAHRIFQGPDFDRVLSDAISGLT